MDVLVSLCEKGRSRVKRSTHAISPWIWTVHGFLIASAIRPLSGCLRRLSGFELHPDSKAGKKRRKKLESVQLAVSTYSITWSRSILTQSIRAPSPLAHELKRHPSLRADFWQRRSPLEKRKNSWTPPWSSRTRRRGREWARSPATWAYCQLQTGWETEREREGEKKTLLHGDVRASLNFKKKGPTPSHSSDRTHLFASLAHPVNMDHDMIPMWNFFQMRCSIDFEYVCMCEGWSNCSSLHQQHKTDKSLRMRHIHDLILPWPFQAAPQPLHLGEAAAFSLQEIFSSCCTNPHQILLIFWDDLRLPILIPHLKFCHYLRVV